jgi:hypothetical protein
MPEQEQFTERSERRVRMAVKRIHERNLRDRKAFGDRKFGTIADLSTDEEMEIYREQRNVPLFWKETFEAKSRDIGVLPPGFLPREQLDSLFAQEAKHLGQEGSQKKVTVPTNGSSEVEIDNDLPVPEEADAI